MTGPRRAMLAGRCAAQAWGRVWHNCTSRCWLNWTPPELNWPKAVTGSSHLRALNGSQNRAGPT